MKTVILPEHITTGQITITNGTGDAVIGKKGMSIIDAVKSGKKFKRPDWRTWYDDSHSVILIEDILAIDWEIEESKIEITESEFDEAWRDTTSMTFKNTVFEEFKKRLFKK